MSRNNKLVPAVIKEWKSCPLCNSKAGFEIKGNNLKCKNCSAEWKVYPGTVELSNPSTNGKGKVLKFFKISMPSDQWIKRDLAKMERTMLPEPEKVKPTRPALMGDWVSFLGWAALLLAFTNIFLVFALREAEDLATLRTIAYVSVITSFIIVIMVCVALVLTGGALKKVEHLGSAQK
jgi:hypothetical protein